MMLVLFVLHYKIQMEPPQFLDVAAKLEFGMLNN